MARTPSTGKLKLWYVPSISNQAAPTATEINAGTNLTAFLRRAGLKRPINPTVIDTSDVSTRYSTTAAGSRGGQPITGEFYRDSVTGSDSAWTTLVENATGFLVVAPFGATPTTGDRVEVWPIEVATREMVDIADNEMQRFTSVMAVTAAPTLTATVG